MSDHTAIEWTDATWNPLRGCSEVSPGCANCYAAGVAARFSGEGQPYEGLARFDANGKAHWTGSIKLVEKALSQPLRWQRSRRVFVNSMSDLFHDDVPNEFIAKVFAVMALATQHTFQVLTKRPRRMLDWFHWCEAQWPRLFPGGGWEDMELEANVVLQFLDDADAGRQVSSDDFPAPWPLPNVWLGVSAEDQTRADERIPLLLRTPAAVRFVSAEPLLGAIDLDRLFVRRINPKKGAHEGGWDLEARLDWVIVGGESGPHARPCHPQWVRDLRDQCQTAGAAFFFKQWGEWLPHTSVDWYRGSDNVEFVKEHGRTGRRWPEAEGRSMLPSGGITLIDLPDSEKLKRRKQRPDFVGTIEGPAYADWQRLYNRLERLPRESYGDLTEEARNSPLAQRLFRELEIAWMYRVGKHAAGRLLDRREWSDFPKALEAVR